MFIDANIFLEIALKDNNYQKCIGFFKDSINSNYKLYTSDFIVYSCLIVLENKLNSYQDMKNFLIFINSLDISIISPNIKTIYDSVEIMKKEKLDFDDALVVSCMNEKNIKKLVSYDKHFDKIKHIEIIKP